MTAPGRRNPRYANGNARRQLRQTVLAEEDLCALCGRLVDKTLNFIPGKHGPRCAKRGCAGCSPHPMRPELDEIVPLARGGSPLQRENVRLTHRSCNAARTHGQPRRARPLSAPTRSPWTW